MFASRSLVGSTFTTAVAFAVSSVLLASPCQAQTGWTIIEPGLVPGATYSQASGVNDNGQIVGATDIQPGGCFLWSSGNGTRELGTLGGWSCYTSNISDAGHVVGASDAVTAGFHYAFVWTSVSGMQNLGTLPEYHSSFAWDVNRSGQVVGYASQAYCEWVCPLPHAFLWSSETGMQDLGALSPEAPSYAYAINDSGQVVGYSFSGDFGRPFLWSSGSGMQDLGALPGYSHCTAYDINNNGQVTGYCQASWEDWRAFVWSSQTGMQELPMLAGASWAYAYGINDQGQIVGAAGGGAFAGDLRAVLWSGGAVIDLNALPEVQAAGWSYMEAWAINNAGQITGWGALSGGGEDGRAFLLSPGPTPKSAECSSAGEGGGAERPQPCVLGNPINPFTGNKFLVETDYTGSGPHPLRFERHYNSNTGLGGGSIGAKWRHHYDRLLIVSGTKARAFRPDGKQYVFTQSGSDWIADPDVADRLGQVGANWVLTSARGDEVETYDANGRLVSIADRAGVAHTLGHVGDVLASVTHSVTGATLAFSYNAAGRIASITDPAGKTYGYGYDAAGNLASVTYPDDTPDPSDNPVRTYVYNEPGNTSGANLPNHLTGIVDENAGRFATYTYASDGRALSTERANGTNKYSVAYGTGGSASVTDPLNRTRTLGSQTLLEVPKNTSVDQPCDRCGLAAATTYDANGYLSGATNFNGVPSTYVHDSRGLETSRVEASGTPQARTITTTWHTTFRRPTQVAEPLRINTNTYDADGSQCGARGALCSTSIQATTDADGSQGFSAMPTGSPRTWTYTYNANGSVLTANGPRTDVSDLKTYMYYANTASCPTADGGHPTGCRGQIESVTNALSQATSITAYNAHGQPLRFVDPNGLITLLGYDARQRLKTRTVGGETTSYDHDKAGQLTRVTLPDGSFLSYGYDDAHRLTSIEDNLGNRVVYTLDAMGNRTLEEAWDPSNQLTQTRSRVYSDLNRLFRELGALSQTTEYTYDNEGNTLTVKDPLDRVSTNQYDALNRLKHVTSPAPISAVSEYGYDGLDQLVSVTDPRGLATSYTVNGLGSLTQQASPDTGTTSRTYDAAGNVATETDAKNQTTTYTYDALNRVTSITFHDGSKHNFTYDSGSNGIGRLTGIAELNPSLAIIGQIAYGYDQPGRRTSQTHTITGIAYTTTYRYDSFGRLDRITYPSGRTIDYAFDAAGRVSAISTTATGGSAEPIVSSVTYQPFGGVKSFSLGNGQAYQRTYDQDGRIATYTLGGASYAVGYDLASRIEFITETANPVNTNTYGYDALDRLTAAVLPFTGYAYTYDAVGNRLTRSAGASTDTYSYSSTSNRIASITPASGPVRNFSFDNNGATTDDAVNTYVYDARGRMVQSVSSLGTTTYQVNALGQRVRKTNTLGDRVYHYDRDGHLIAESTAAGATLREYVWLGDTPVAVISGSTRSYVHVDHLNTPRLVANQSGQTVWRWDQQEPFGNNVADENPSGLGAFDLPLRLPGQYLDKETNLHYNYYRDYDPSVGRYGESDPIGLRAGLNTYAYVLSNPLSYLDPFGLDVKVCYYYEAAGGFGHIGFGVGAETGTQGYYPTGNPLGSRGVVQDDTQKTKECKVIPANPDQDSCMLDCRARRKNDPGTYALNSNQCTSFVRECLKICGLPAGNYPGTAPRPQFLGLPGKGQ